MALSLLQKGVTGALVVLFFPTPIGALRKKVLRALGPVPTVVLSDDAKAGESLEEILGFARATTGRDGLLLVCLCGFSAGCQRVRALRIAGAEALAYLFVDGAHASNPPATWQIDYLRDLADRARRGEITVAISHTYIVTEPRFLSTVAVARLATGFALPKPPPGQFRTTSEGQLVVYSVHSGANDTAAHSAQAHLWLPMLLDGHVRPLLEPGYEPGTIPMLWSEVPRRVFTVDGWLDLEDDYVPRVVTRENGNAAPEALKAQAVAARTYVLRAMRDKPGLGTPLAPIRNTQQFQTYAAKATAACIAATKATAWQVATYQNELIVSCYVAGARWSEDGVPLEGTDPLNTERWVTYNEVKFGDGVEPTKLALHRKQNRGCMSQNGADWLARHGYGYLGILRCFYGADMDVLDLREAPLAPGAVDRPPTVPAYPAPRPAPGRSTRAADGGPLVVLIGAAAVLAMRRDL
ncbi:MAG TPA: SpoIID/LytB domain-containing protein [Candidatus Nanopelagicales bacterium]|nr:SpoIID/LytB domain-containing protein [Candidatus Nanopelagicales bacterium]